MSEVCGLFTPRPPSRIRTPSAGHGSNGARRHLDAVVGSRTQSPPNRGTNPAAFPLAQPPDPIRARSAECGSKTLASTRPKATGSPRAGVQKRFRPIPTSRNDLLRARSTGRGSKTLASTRPQATGSPRVRAWTNNPTDPNSPNFPAQDAQRRTRIESSTAGGEGPLTTKAISQGRGKP
jgi:hypothetical protein